MFQCKNFRMIPRTKQSRWFPLMGFRLLKTIGKTSACNHSGTFSVRSLSNGRRTGRLPKRILQLLMALSSTNQALKNQTEVAHINRRCESQILSSPSRDKSTTSKYKMSPRLSLCRRCTARNLATLCGGGRAASSTPLVQLLLKE